MRICIIPPSPRQQSSPIRTHIPSSCRHFLSVPTIEHSTPHKRRRHQQQQQQEEPVPDSSVVDIMTPPRKRRITAFSPSSKDRITHLLSNALKRPWSWCTVYDALAVDDHGQWRNVSMPRHEELIQGILLGRLKLRVDVQSDGDNTGEIRGYLCTISQASVKKAWALSKDASLDDLEHGGTFFQRCLFGMELFD